MEKILFGAKRHFYKANLHCHTNISDGKYSPEEIKKLYKEQGYSIVAYSDHEVLVPHNDLADKDFLPLTSYEFIITDEAHDIWGITKTMHINAYALDKNKDISKIFNPKNVWLNKSFDYINKDQLNVNYQKEYSTRKINEMIKIMKKDGFLISLNHPVWSCISYPDYINLKNLWAVEIWNTGCVYAGQNDTTTPYMDLLHKNQKIVALANDDNHQDKDMFGGYNIINASKLDYDVIMKEMKKGNLYASSGAIIKKISIDENNVVTVLTENAQRIELNTDRRFGGCALAKESPLTEAKFDIDAYVKNAPNGYFRISILDMNGKFAYSKGYFIKDIIK